MLQGIRVRVAETAKERAAQALAVTALLIGPAALAAPVVERVATHPLLTSVQETVQLTSAPLEEPKQSIWIGADVDGDGAADFVNPTGGELRGHDAYGYGEFGASRDGGSRSHEGVDFVARANQPVEAPISGYVSKIGFAYEGDSHLKFVEITNPALHYQARVFYVDPTVEVGQAVALGNPIGRHHTLATKYPGHMTDHVHLEILDKRGRRIDGTKMIMARLETSATVQAD